MSNQAADKIIEVKALIDAELAELQAKSDNHFDVNPDKAHWGHVGSLQHILELLQQANGKVD